MNVSADVMVLLAQKLGASTGLKADGVVRTAIERLTGEREFHVEVLDDGGEGWVFHSFHDIYAEAQLVRSQLRAQRPENLYRIVELLRRVMP